MLCSVTDQSKSISGLVSNSKTEVLCSVTELSEGISGLVNVKVKCCVQ